MTAKIVSVNPLDPTAPPTAVGTDTTRAAMRPYLAFLCGFFSIAKMIDDVPHIAATPNAAKNIPCAHELGAASSDKMVMTTA